jgi:hypothetical protein
MATPLTLYVPIKQDPDTQAAAKAFHHSFVNDAGKGPLQDSHMVHYARIALVPNPGGTGTLALLLITTFDGPMDPYLGVFWDNDSLRKAFTRLAQMAINPQCPPVSDLNTFQTFCNNNNLSEPKDLYSSYPQTVRQIQAKFSSSQ